MKKAIIILGIIVFITGGCGQARSNQTEIESKVVKEQEENRCDFEEEYDTISGENEEKNFRQIGLDEKIGNQTLKDYLTDEKIPQIFKDVFQQKQTIFEEEEKTLALIDSLFSTDTKRHPFYFVLVTRALWWADGAFAEPLGVAVREYVESNTQQFLAYFSTEVVLTQFDFKHWARFTLFEILIDSEDNVEQQIENTERLMKENCINCSSKKTKMIDKFIKKMYAEHKRIQRMNREWEKNNL